MSYSSEVLADSPVAYYRHNESSGSTLVDEIAGLNGTYTSVTLGAASLLASDPASKAVTFSSASRADTSLYAAMQAEVITVEAWLRPGSLTDRAEFLTRGSAAGYNNAQSWRFIQNGQNLEARVYVNNSGTSAIATATNVFTTLGAVYHVAFTFDGATIRVYCNGAEVATTARTGTLNPGTHPLRWGVDTYTGGYRYTGDIDETAIYTHVLSPTRITAHYQAGISTTPTVPEITLAGTAAAATGSFTLESQAPAAATEITLAGTAQAAEASFSLDTPVPAAEVALAGVAKPARGSFTVRLPAMAEATTDSVDRANGRTRVCEWTVEVEPPVTSPTRDRGLDEVQTYSISGTTLVDGRPT